MKNRYEIKGKDGTKYGSYYGSCPEEAWHKMVVKHGVPDEEIRDIKRPHAWYWTVDVRMAG